MMMRSSLEPCNRTESGVGEEAGRGMPVFTGIRRCEKCGRLEWEDEQEQE